MGNDFWSLISPITGYLEVSEPATPPTNTQSPTMNAKKPNQCSKNTNWANNSALGVGLGIYEVFGLLLS